jgi:shikimate kinase
MMGAGKTSVGRALAAAHQLVFIDLDRRIELMFAASIAALFERGEPEFRRLERIALLTLLDEPGFAGSAAVVATGGGVVLDPNNLRDMGRVGRLVYLHVDAPSLCARLSAPAQWRTRPLLADGRLEERLATMLAAREPAYRRADIVVDARGPVTAVASDVWRSLRGPDR